MKKIASYALFFCLFGCSKLEQYLKPEKRSSKSCNIKEQLTGFADSGTHLDVPFPYFKKTYYPDGAVKTLYAILHGNFGQVDTLDYLFIPSSNEIEIRLYAKGLENFNNPYPPDTLNFTTHFDPTSGYVTKIGDDEFKYVNNQLVEACLHKLEYDETGNLIYLKQMGVTYPETHAGLQYEYDYTRKAGKNDFYNPAGLMFGRSYCLAEMMGWLPPSCKNIRTKEKTNCGETGNPENEYIVYTRSFRDHSYNSDGLLISVRYNELQVNNNWQCKNQ